MQGLWTNRNSLSDFIKNALQFYQRKVSDIYIAVAFFTEKNIVQEFIDNNCHVRMIVRLGFPTNPTALRQLITNRNIEIRYYSDPSFHPKLYIFGDQVALLGSANLTTSAVLTNQEIIVSIESDDPRFDELGSLFSDYWDESQVLTTEVIDKYESIYKKYQSSINNIYKIDSDIHDNIGKTTFSNINRGTIKKTKENIFLDSYRKTYQESVAAFERIKEVYVSFNKRKNNSSNIPLRIEVDSFFSFVRDTYATKESWKEQPIGWDDGKKLLLKDHINEWLNTNWSHYDDTICHINYPRIIKTFKDKESIKKATFDEIIEALVVLHSFHDRLRFFNGGLETLLKSFKEENDFEKVKESLTYLLHGDSDIIRRMVDLIYNNSYKLNQFGQSNVQELIGWVNKEELPVINGRTTKVLRYYGFDVRQL